MVIGHSIETIEGAPAADAVYTALYAFHMPAFLLISGWFARSGPLDRTALTGIGRLVLVWLITEGGWVLLRLVLGETPLPGDLLVVQSWTLWYLVALVLMRLALPLIALLRAPVLVTALAAIAVGLLPAVGEPFAASRTIALLPFFVLGWRLRRAGVGSAAWFRDPPLRLRAAAAGAAVLAIAAVLALRMIPGYSREFLYWRSGYDAMGWDVVPGMLLRLATGAIAVVLIAAVLLLVPRGRHRFSVIGANSLAIYLLHAPIVETLNRTGVIAAVGTLPAAVPILAACAVVAVLLLGSRPVARVMRPVLEPDRVLARLLPPRRTGAPLGG